MARIFRDEVGLYVTAGGWVARPFGGTRFKEGDEVPTHHFGGTTRAGVGRPAKPKRGEYLENWCTTGLVLHYGKISVCSNTGIRPATKKEIRDQTKWYRENAYFFERWGK